MGKLAKAAGSHGLNMRAHLAHGSGLCHHECAHGQCSDKPRRPVEEYDLLRRSKLHHLDAHRGAAAQLERHERRLENTRLRTPDLFCRRGGGYQPFGMFVKRKYFYAWNFP